MPIIANSADDISKAYPDELLPHIEAYTKGKVKPGDVIRGANVDVVDLLDPITYQQVKTMGRRINIIESTKDVTKLFPPNISATVRNKGTAKRMNGNVVTNKGTPWNGAIRFPTRRRVRRRWPT